MLPEVAAFFNDVMNVRLSDDDVAALEARTKCCAARFYSPGFTTARAAAC